MAINIYDEPAQAQFMNTYVPIPFQEMLAAGQAKQARYDKAGNAMDSAIASAEDIVAIPNSDDERRANEYVAKLRTVRDKYVGKDISDPFVQRDMINDMNRSVNRDDIKHIQQSYQGYVAYNKMLAENEQRGVATPPELRERFEGYDSSRRGVFTGVAPVYLDPMDETSKFFSQVKAEPLGSGREIIDGKWTGRVYATHGITEDRLVNYADKNMKSFLQLPAIRQMVNVARARGDGRDASEIAIDYVRSNAKHFSGAERSNYAFDPNYKGSGDTDNIPNNGVELIRQHGMDKNKSYSTREVNKEMASYNEKALNGDTGAANTVEAVRRATAAKADMPREGSLMSPNLSISTAREKANAAFDTAFSALKGLGMDEVQAFDYLLTNSATNDWGHTLSMDVVKGRWQNFTESTGLRATKQDLLNPIRLARMFPNKEDVDKMRAYTQSINEQYEKAKTSSPKTKEQVLANYKTEVDQADKTVKKANEDISKIETETFNEMMATQSTYTPLQGKFKWNNGTVEGSFFDKNGVRKGYESHLGQDVGNAIANPGDYPMTFYDLKGKELGQKKLNDIRTSFNKSDGFNIEAIDNRTTKNNGVVVTVGLFDDKGKPTGERFRVEVPMAQMEDAEGLINELTGRQQYRTAFSLMHLSDIENKINSLDAYSNKAEIPLSSLGADTQDLNDKIVLNPNQNGTFNPILIYKGEEIDIASQFNVPSISLNNLPVFISSYITYI